jgi:DNA-binding CsgD family transcriptional regulator
MGLGDELRAVLRIGDACWGYLCLHREQGHAFTAAEARFVQRIAAHLAEGIRSGLLLTSIDTAPTADAPGLILLTGEGAILSMTVAGQQWLDELGYRDVERHAVPYLISALAAQLLADQSDTVPRLRVRTRSGRWAVMHASRLAGSEPDTIAVIIEEPKPTELAPVLMMVYGLTSREREIAALVCRGMSTREISERLHITTNTVQEHLKSVFEKVGVRSRRELVTAILQQQYMPRVLAGISPTASGFFVD